MYEYFSLYEIISFLTNYWNDIKSKKRYPNSNVRTCLIVSVFLVFSFSVFFSFFFLLFNPHKLLYVYNPWVAVWKYNQGQEQGYFFFCILFLFLIILCLFKHKQIKIHTKNKPKKTKYKLLPYHMYVCPFSSPFSKAKAPEAWQYFFFYIV